MIDKSVVYLSIYISITYKSRIVYQELYQQVKLVYSVLSNLSQINNNNLQMSMPYLYTRIEPSNQRYLVQQSDSLLLHFQGSN